MMGKIAVEWLLEQFEARPAGALVLPDDSVCWNVWAPRAKQVDLVLIDNSSRRSFPMKAEKFGYFSHTHAGIPEGQRYALRINGGPERPDPASRWQPDGVHGPSAVLRPENFSWSEGNWQGLKREDLVFYELHVGTFTPEGTFDAVIPRLDSLRELGITALEIMPVAQFPGNRNWGYDGVNLFAPQNSYGGPHGLQRLVNACHSRGLGIYLDVVYNHLGPEGNYLNDFGHFFADYFRTAWGPAFNYDRVGCDAVRAFILENVRLWIGTYRMDGLRLDAVHAIFDAGPKHILQAIKETADEIAAKLRRPAHIIAESDLNDVRLLLPPERGGFGLDAQWSDDFHHAIHTHFTGERQGYYEDFGQVQHLPKVLEKTFVHDGTFSRFRNRCHGASAGDLSGDHFVVCLQNHDQIGNRARGDRLSQLTGPAAQRLAASLLLIAPHLPLLFMGEEYGETHPFLFFCSFADGRLIKNVREGRRREFAAFAWQGEVPDPQAESTFAASRLTWSWPEGTPQAGLRRLYRELLQVRRSWPALKNYRDRTARLLRGETEAAVLSLVRGEPGNALSAFFNLTRQRQPLTSGPPPGEDHLFSSEANRYLGNRQAADSWQELLPYECLVFGNPTWEKLV